MKLSRESRPSREANAERATQQGSGAGSGCSQSEPASHYSTVLCHGVHAHIHVHCRAGVCLRCGRGRPQDGRRAPARAAGDSERIVTPCVSRSTVDARHIKARAGVEVIGRGVAPAPRGHAGGDTKTMDGNQRPTPRRTRLNSPQPGAARRKRTPPPPPPQVRAAHRPCARAQRPCPAAPAGCAPPIPPSTANSTSPHQHAAAPISAPSPT